LASNYEANYTLERPDQDPAWNPSGEQADEKTKLDCVRFEVLTAVTVKNVVFWYTKPQFVLTGDTLPLHYRAHGVNAM
jgi:hypothetical protein